VAAANAKRDAQIAANQSLPKAQRQSANQAAKDVRNAEVAAANDQYKSAAAAANAARDVAKTEWQASKK